MLAVYMLRALVVLIQTKNPLIFVLLTFQMHQLQQVFLQAGSATTSYERKFLIAELVSFMMLIYFNSTEHFESFHEFDNKKICAGDCPQWMVQPVTMFEIVGANLAVLLLLPIMIKTNEESEGKS